MRGERVSRYGVGCDGGIVRYHRTIKVIISGSRWSQLAARRICIEVRWAQLAARRIFEVRWSQLAARRICIETTAGNIRLVRLIRTRALLLVIRRRRRVTLLFERVGEVLKLTVG